jgi:hypothetical protein
MNLTRSRIGLGWTLSTAVLISLVTLSCAVMSSAPRQSDVENPEDKESKFIKPEAIEGCYEVGTLTWRPDLKLGEDAEFITPPRRIHISAEHGSEGFEKDWLLGPTCTRSYSKYPSRILLGSKGTK